VPGTPTSGGSHCSCCGCCCRWTRTAVPADAVLGCLSAVHGTGQRTEVELCELELMQLTGAQRGRGEWAGSLEQLVQQLSESICAVHRLSAGSATAGWVSSLNSSGS